MRLIDADALIEKMLKESQDYNDITRLGYHNCEILAYEAPTIDAIEVVRCKNCKHYNAKTHNCSMWIGWARKSDFCSYGERADH